MEPLPARVESRFPNARNSYTETGYLTGPFSKELLVAIDRLYSAFAGAALSTPLTACPHCFTGADIEYLVTMPVRSLSHGDLAVIATKLISTLGEPEDVAYFVPRIVEAIAEGATFDIDAFAERLAQMPDAMWTVERIDALKGVFTLLFAATDGTWDDLASERTREHLKRALPER